MKERVISNHLSFLHDGTAYRNYLANYAENAFTTGFYTLDQCIGGVGPGEVLTIIAYSGTFKSAFLQNLLWRGCRRNGLYHLFFSQEMSKEKCFERQIQLVGGTNGFQVREDYLKLESFYLEQAKKLRSDRMVLYDLPKVSLKEIFNVFCFVEAKYGQVGAIGVDYLGLMASDGKNIFERTAEITFGMKTLAKEINRPIILLAQTSRAYAASKGLEIEMDSGKGGGDIEAGADFLLGLYMHERDLICRLLKNRNGPANAYFKVDIDYPSLTFRDMTRWEPPKKERRIQA